MNLRFLRYALPLALSGALIATEAPDGAAAAAASCPALAASSALAFKSDQHGDAGIATSGFVLPSDSSPVVHGIDVSKYQTDPIFAGVRVCGGAFVYVRLSAGTDGDNELEYRTFGPTQNPRA